MIISVILLTLSFASVPSFARADMVEAMILNKFAPLERKKLSAKKTNAAWYNSDLQEMKVVKRRLERAWASNPSNEAWSAHRTHCNDYYNRVIEAKRSHFSGVVLGAANDSKKIFSISRSLLGLKKTTVSMLDPRAFVESFGVYFNDKIEQIRIKIVDLNNNNAPLVSNNNSTNNVACTNMFSNFNLCCTDSVRKIISSRSRAHCDALDPLPFGFIKDNVDSFLPIITRIVNLSLQEGIIPISLRHAICQSNS